MTNRAALKVAREQGHNMKADYGSQTQAGTVTYSCRQRGCEALMRIENGHVEERYQRDRYGWMKPCPNGGET